jgi:type I restriction enzyme M protein
MNPASDLVNKLWRLCAVLRKDGITYQQYVTELTYLLFVKMIAEQKRAEDRIPEGAGATSPPPRACGNCRCTARC